MTNTIFKKEHLCKPILCCEENGITRTLIVLTSSDSSLDEILCHNCLINISRYSLTDCEESVILPDRSDVLLRDVIIRRSKSTITNKDSSCDFLIKHDSHLTTDPRNNVEICDINDIITIKLLLLIDGLWSSCSLQECEYFLSLSITLNITLSSCLISCDVSEYRLNSAKRCVLCSVHYNGNPICGSLDPIRGIVEGLCLGEQETRIIYTIILYICGILNSRVSICMSKLAHGIVERFLKSSSARLSFADDMLNIAVAKNCAGIHCGIKYICLHVIFSFIKI